MALLGLMLQACSMTRGPDPEAALFAALFDVPRGSCKELRVQLREEIEGITAAKKKSRDDLVAEEEAKETQSPRLARKEDRLAALRDWAKKSEQADKLNAALRERRCRTVDIEAAVK